MPTRARRPASRSLAPAALGLVVLTLAGPGCEPPQSKLPPPPPPEVAVCLPVSDYVSDFEEFPGRTEAVYSVEIRARVNGYLDKVLFADGAEVEKDDLLFEIDPRPYQAELERTKATLAQSEARFKRLEADLKRANNLYSRGNISREEFDKVVGDRDEGEASVGISRSGVRLAELNAEFTKVRSPIAGRLSRRLVDPGNLVQADMTPLTTVVSFDPMYVYFDVDERTLLTIRRLIAEGKVKSRQEADVPVYAGLSDEDDFSHKGLINFSDNKVDANTGTLRVRASIENPKPRVLSPGMFMRIRLPVGNPRKSLLVPEQAVGTDQGRKFLYLLNAKDEVVATPVEVGRLEKGLREVSKGLRPDSRVVFSGLQRVRPGAKVAPKLMDNPGRPAANPTPASAPPAEAPAAKESAKHAAG